MPVSRSYHPSPTYNRLSEAGGEPFYDIVSPAKFPRHQLRYRNNEAARSVGLDDLDDPEWTDHFGRFNPLPGNFEQPLAIRYHGHQFRHYNPEIGDGRGFLFAQLRDHQERLLDLGTKGSGQTPYSRFGDGRLTLKGAVREILATEMLEALGVYTSKTLSVIETGEQLDRNDEPSPTRSAVMVRLSHSHVRFGVFQRLAYEGNADAIADLVEYCIAHFFPSLDALAGDARIVAFYERVIAHTARLAAQWMAAGFVHGVLNTDNMNVTGESFDYGPWRFLPTVDPAFTAAYFDQTGLYAYGRQPEAAAWNLAQLGGTLTLLVDQETLTQTLQSFPGCYERHVASAFSRRLGLVDFGCEMISGESPVVVILRWMQEAAIPFEQFFFDWFGGKEATTRAERSPVASHYKDPTFRPVHELMIDGTPNIAASSPAPFFERSTPPDLLIDTVESLWDAIATDDDWDPLTAKISEIRQMKAAYSLAASTWHEAPEAMVGAARA